MLPLFAPRVRSASSAATAGGSLLVAAMTITLLLPASASAAATAVPLGNAGSFGVLAGAGITNTGPTTINGDIGTFPTTSISGTATMTVNGVNHGGDAVTQAAKNDLIAAYDNAAGQGPQNPIVGNLGGQTLVAGVYSSAASIALTGTLTLNAAGNPDAVFVFQAGSSLTTASGSSVNLINGAQSCNVFWQVGSSATLGTNSSFVGTVLALTDITVTTSAVIAGRVLARNGAVTLDTNTISRPACAAPQQPPQQQPPTPTPSPAATATSTPTPSATPTTTPTGTPSATPTTTPTATPTATGTAAPTSTPTPAATATPTSTRPPGAAPITTASAATSTAGAAAPGEMPALGLGPRAGLGAAGAGSGGSSGTGQVTGVPSGGVSAGDGNGSPADGVRNGVAAAAALGFLGSAVVVVRRRTAR